MQIKNALPLELIAKRVWQTASLKKLISIICRYSKCRIEYWSDSIEVDLHVYCCPPHVYILYLNALTCHACVV